MKSVLNPPVLPYSYRSLRPPKNGWRVYSSSIKGLLGAMDAIDPSLILSYDYGTYKGYFAENFVGQQIRAITSQPLFRWQEDRSEIEFLLTYHGKTTPIEVKSGTVTRAKSLEKYINKYHPQHSIILSANPAQTNHKNAVFHLPLYLY